MTPIDSDLCRVAHQTVSIKLSGASENSKKLQGEVRKVTVLGQEQRGGWEKSWQECKSWPVTVFLSGL